MRLARTIAPIILFACAPALPPRSVAVTVDDLPYVGPPPSPGRTRASVLAQIAAHVREAGATAWGFVSAERGGLSALRAWLDAGLPLGNHTYSHRPYSREAPAAFLADVRRNEEAVRTAVGAELRGGYFRYPFLDHGHTEEKVAAMVAYLAANRYRHAPVSLDTLDYRFATAYARAIDRAAVGRLYVEHVTECARYFEGLSRRLFGREIPLVLLVHANELNADRLGAVLAALRHRGYRFVRLEEALADPAYTRYGPRPPHLPREGDRNFLNQVALSRGLRLEGPCDDGPFKHRWMPRIRPHLR